MAGATSARARLLTSGALAVQFLVLAALLARELPAVWEQRWVQDDAYVSFRYARNLLAGHGLVYNIGHRVEGYTNFLWTMLSAVPMAAGMDDPLPAMQGLGLALCAATYLVLFLLGLALFRAGHAVAPLAAVPLLQHYSFNLWFVSGMETPLVSFLVAAALLLFTLDPERWPRSPNMLAATCAALLLTRPDSVCVLAGLGVAALFTHRNAIRREPRARLLAPALLFLAIYLPYTIWRVTYYGEFLPNTYYAKIGYLTYYARGWEYLRTYLDLYPLRHPLLLVPLGALLATDDTTRRFLWGATAAGAAVFWYVVRLGGDFMEWRFLTPVTGVLYPAVVVAAGTAASRLFRLFAPPPLPRVCAATISATAALLLAVATHRAVPLARHERIPGQETIALLSRYARVEQYDWLGAARVFDRVIPRNASIATSSAGMIPFYLGERHTLDLCGLTDPIIARREIDPNNRGRMGHEVCLEDYGATRQRGIHIYLRWVNPTPYPASLFTETPPGTTMVSVQLDNGSYADFVILNEQGIDVAAMRNDPRLVFPGSRPVVDRHQFYLHRKELSALTVIDRIDLETAADHAAHHLEERFPLGGLRDYHTKMLPYREPHTDLVVLDDEFFPQDVEWDVFRVRPATDLLMVIRYDLGGGGTFRVDINGKSLPRPLSFPRGGEYWDELVYTIPAAFVTAGTNRIRLVLASDERAELAYVWFLQ